MLVFDNYFYKNKKSKLHFGDRVVVLNDSVYQTGGSIFMKYFLVNFVMARYLEVTCVMYFQPVDLMKIYEINIIG
jgi:hypothetical protein